MRCVACGRRELTHAFNRAGGVCAINCASRGCRRVHGGGAGSLPWLCPTGSEGSRVPARDSYDSDSVRKETRRTTATVTTDYSTLGRLRKNINELDSLINSLEESQQPQSGASSHKTTVVRETVVPVRTIQKEAPTSAAAPVSPTSTKVSKTKITKTEEIKTDPMETAVSLALASAKQSTTTTTTKRTTESHSGETHQRKVPRGEGSKWTLCGVPVWPLLPSSFHAFFLFSCSSEGFSLDREVIPCGTSAFKISPG